jgi:PAS domain S-box-containing protein
MVMKKKLAKLKTKLFGVHNSYKQLEKENHQCALLIKDSTLPIIFLSGDGLITYANHSFVKMIDCSHSEIINKPALLFFKTQQDNFSDKRFFVDMLKRQLKDHDIQEIEYIKRNGEVGWVALESLTYKRETINHERCIQCVLRDVTREKELQIEIDLLHKTIREQAMMFRNLIENTEGHIVVRKIDDTITWANNRFLETFGFSSEEVIGKSELNLWPVEVQRKIRVATRVAIRNKERKTIELSINNNGKLVAVLMTIFPMFNESGVVEFTGVLAVDVNRMKVTELELESARAEAVNSKNLLSNFICNATNPIYSSDIDDRITMVNKAFADIYNKSVEDFLGKSRSEVEVLIGRKINQGILDAYDKVVKEGKAVTVETSVLDQVSKKTTHLSFTRFPLFSVDGDITGVGAIVTDITQSIEHQIELTLLKVEADKYKEEAEYQSCLMQSYLDNIPYYVTIFDQGGILRFINHYALSFWNMARKDVIGKHYAEFTENNMFIEQFTKNSEFVIKEQKSIKDESVFSFPNKGELTLLTNIFPLFDKNNCLFAFGVFRVDITEKKAKDEVRERLQEKVKMQNALFNTVLGSTSDFISIKGKDHRYIMVNPAFANVLHLAPTDFIGKDDLELGFPEELVKGNLEKGITGFWADNNLVMDSGQIQVLPFEQFGIDGVVHTFRTSKIPLKNADGEVWGVLTFARDISDELLKQEALCEAKDLFHKLYKSTPAMLYSTDKDGVMITVSDYWLQIMGYNREEALGQKLSTFVTMESLQYSREVVWPIFMKNGACFNEEFQFVKKNGEILTCLLSAIGEMDADGQLVSTLEVIVDITELRRTELEVADSKRLLTDFLENIPYSAMILDLEQHYVVINENTARLHELTKKELIGVNYEDQVTNSENVKQLNEIYTYVKVNQKPLSITWSLNLLTGESINVKSYTFPIYNSKSEFTHIGSIVNDITDQVRKETELVEAKNVSERSKQLLKSFMDNATSAMFAKDANGLYILINEKKKQYDLLRKLERFNPELNSVEFYSSKLSKLDDARVITQNRPMIFYDKLLCEDDSVLYTETVKFPIYDNNSELIGVGCITNDITEMSIREKELKEARQIAEVAASSQERFLASMSHDMRTPLNGVVGMINLLEQTPLSAEQKKYLEAMKVSSYNLRVLINDILDVSKIQAGKLNIECVLFNLSEILSAINSVFIHEASRRGILFSIEKAPDIPLMLEGDPARLNQILNNLIGNSLKFTAHGFVKLKLEYENISDNKVNIEFVIEDSGIGISADGLGKLFQPFVQASSDTSRKFGGSGLGLAICKSLVDLQQGEISVSSELGKGSIFRFSITYIKAEPIEIEQAKQKNNVNELVSILPFASMRCLVVEDNLINQMVAFHTLKNEGIDADMANNGKIGVDILKKNAALYDFVLMDIEMPEMDGYEATIVIRNELGLDIPIIAMTASVLKGGRDRCLAVGMNEFVPKPFQVNELLYAIKNVLTSEKTKVESIKQSSTEVIEIKVNDEIVAAQTKPENVPLYDLSNILEMDDVDFTLEILNMFFDTVPKALQELKISIAQATDWDTVTKVAHKLKGSVGVLQMSEMISHLSTIEMNARNREELHQLPEALDACCCIYDAVEDEIIKFRDEVVTKM